MTLLTHVVLLSTKGDDLKGKLLKETPAPKGSSNSEHFEVGYLERYIDKYSIYGLSRAFIARFAILRLKRQRNEMNPDLLEKLSYHEKVCSIKVRTYELQLKYDGCGLSKEFVSALARFEIDLNDGDLQKSDYEQLELFRKVAQEAFQRNEHEKREKILFRSRSGLIAPSEASRTPHSESNPTGHHNTDEYQAASSLRNESSINELMGLAEEVVALSGNSADED